jgi:hypothetical protein
MVISFTMHSWYVYHFDSGVVASYSNHLILSVDLLTRTSTFCGWMMMKKIALVTVSRLDRSENEPHLAGEDVLQMVKISGLELTLGL